MQIQIGSKSQFEFVPQGKQLPTISCPFLCLINEGQTSKFQKKFKKFNDIFSNFNDIFSHHGDL
jgi:hypothetical protein